MSENSFSDNEWKAIAEWVEAEFQRRKGAPRRKELERCWKEVDRQVAMKPVPRLDKPKNEGWLPDIELPLQFNTLEVNCADARRLMFPRGAEWYTASAHLSDTYLDRWEKRRETKPIIGDKPFPSKLDQETANTLVKVTMDHYHQLYDIRSMVDLFNVECVKYGTAVWRIKEVNTQKFFNDFRGTQAMQERGPAVVPCSIRNVYLDDTPMAVMNEGINMSPGHIRCTYKHYTDVQKSMLKGGTERGWLVGRVNKLLPERSKDEKNFHLNIIEFEGDLVVPRLDDTKPIFLPGVIVTIAAGRNVCEVIRYCENDYPFPSYIIGHYMRDCLDSPYGTCPLIKGQSLHEACVEAANDLLTAGALAARPPLWYDASDPWLTAKGGPLVFPGSMCPTNAPDSIEVMQSADVAKLLQVYLALLKQYEDLTAVNDPRRGGPMRSHTTATAADLEQTRGLNRTDDWVQGVEQGPVTTLLYREYEIIKKCMKSAVPIKVDAGGIDGWVTIAAADLADDIFFRVHGSAGVLDERQQFEKFMQGTNASLQLVGVAMQSGIQIPINFLNLIMETYKRAGINNAANFIGPNSVGSGDPAGGASLTPPVPVADTGIPTNTLTNVQASVGKGL